MDSQVSKCDSSHSLTGIGCTYGQTIFSQPNFVGCLDNQILLPIMLRYKKVKEVFLFFFLSCFDALLSKTPPFFTNLSSKWTYKMNYPPGWISYSAIFYICISLSDGSNTVKPLLSGPSIKRTPSRVPKLTSYISLHNEPLFSGHLY